MKKRIEELKDNYITIRHLSLSMKNHVSNGDDAIKLEAGVVTFDLVIEDLEKLLNEWPKSVVIESNVK